jgi:hypothetical protein
VVTRTGDTHSSYLASVTGTGAKDYDNLKLNRQINSDDIRAWISEHPGQIKELAKILVETEPADDSSEAFDDETYEAFRKIVSASPNVIRNLGEAASESLNLRIEKVKQEADEFSLLLCDDKSNETTCQTWLEEHPWVFGLEYVKVRKGQQTSRGYVDFLLERYDGFHDLLELKSPQDDIIVSKEGKDTDTIPSPTNYKLSDSLSNAIAQAHSYKVRLSRDEKHMEEEHGVKNSGSPRLIVVVGLKEKMPQHSALILDELNRSLHGVEIIPYDLIAKRARMLVANAEKFLIGIPTDSESNEQ